MKSTSKEAGKEKGGAGKGSAYNIFYPWGTVFNSMTIAESWGRFFKFGESLIPEAVREKTRLQMRAATLNCVHGMNRGTPQQRDAVFLALKGGVEVLIANKGPASFYERGRMLWFETFGDAIFMLWDPRGVELLRDMAKELRGWKGEMRKDALRLAGRYAENAKLLDESKSIPGMRNLEDAFGWAGHRPLGP